MSSTEKELKRGYGHIACSHGNGDQENCQTCQDRVAAFWDLMNGTALSPMRWDDKRGKYVYRRA